MTDYFVDLFAAGNSYASLTGGPFSDESAAETVAIVLADEATDAPDGACRSVATALVRFAPSEVTLGNGDRIKVGKARS